MTTRIRYDGPGHLLVIDEKTSIGRWKAANVPDDVAKMLVECDWADVTVIPASAKPAWPTSSEALDELAVQFEITWPPPGVNKTKLSVAEKADALKAAGYTPDAAYGNATPAPAAEPDTKENQ